MVGKTVDRENSGVLIRQYRDHKCAVIVGGSHTPGHVKQFLRRYKALVRKKGCSVQ